MLITTCIVPLQSLQDFFFLTHTFQLREKHSDIHFEISIQINDTKEVWTIQGYLGITEQFFKMPKCIFKNVILPPFHSDPKHMEQVPLVLLDVFKTELYKTKTKAFASLASFCWPQHNAKKDKKKPHTPSVILLCPISIPSMSCPIREKRFPHTRVLDSADGSEQGLSPHSDHLLGKT